MSWSWKMPGTLYGPDGAVLIAGAALGALLGGVAGFSRYHGSLAKLAVGTGIGAGAGLALGYGVVGLRFNTDPKLSGLDAGTTYRIRSSDTLMPGERLPPNTRLKSQNRKAYLVLQDDRNVVLYETATGRPLWSTHTNWDLKEKFQGAFVMQDDGNAVLVDAQNRPIWATATNGHPGARLVVQNDGNMVIYQGNDAVWNSETWNFTDHHESHDVFSEVGNFVSGVANGAIDALHLIPGVDWVGDVLKDFANTDVGKFLLRQVSAVMLPVIGVAAAGLGLPMILLVPLGTVAEGATFTMPGLLRGESVDVAFVNELAAAVKNFSDKWGAQLGDLVADHLGDLLGKAASAIQDWADKNNIDLDKLANETEDVRNEVAKKIDPKALAESAGGGLTADLAQIMIDAATRTVNPNNNQFGPNGDLLKKVSIAPGMLNYTTNIDVDSSFLSKAKSVSVKPAPAPAAVAPLPSGVVLGPAPGAALVKNAVDVSAPAPKPLATAPAPELGFYARGFAALAHLTNKGTGTG